MIEIQTLFKLTPIQKVIPWVLNHSVPDYITTDCLGSWQPRQALNKSVSVLNSSFDKLFKYTSTNGEEAEYILFQAQFPLYKAGLLIKLAINARTLGFTSKIFLHIQFTFIAQHD